MNTTSKKSLRTLLTKALALVLAAVMIAGSMTSVSSAKTKVKKPALSKKTLTLTKGKTAKLTIKKNGNKIKSTKFSSTKKSVAKVSKKGVVTAVKAGKANIKAVVKVKSGKKYTLTCKVTVKEAKKPDAPINIEPEEPVGGWTDAESPVVTAEVQSIVDTVNNSNDGAYFEPKALLATQVVSGMKYRVFCKCTELGTQMTTEYAIADFYKNPAGKCSLTDCLDTNVLAYTGGEEGGWNESETPVISKGEGLVFDKAFEGLGGVDYTPVAMVATKIIRGTEYCFLAKQQVVVPDSTPEYCFVYISGYADGSVELNDIVNLPVMTDTDTVPTVGAPLFNVDGVDVNSIAFEMVGTTPNFFVKVANNTDKDVDFDLSKFKIIGPSGSEAFPLLPIRTVPAHSPYRAYTFTDIHNTLNEGDVVTVSYDGKDLGTYVVGRFA